MRVKPLSFLEIMQSSFFFTKFFFCPKKKNFCFFATFLSTQKSWGYKVTNFYFNYSKIYFFGVHFFGSNSCTGFGFHEQVFLLYCTKIFFFGQHFFECPKKRWQRNAKAFLEKLYKNKDWVTAAESKNPRTQAWRHTHHKSAPVSWLRPLHSDVQ